MSADIIMIRSQLALLEVFMLEHRCVDSDPVLGKVLPFRGRVAIRDFKMLPHDPCLPSGMRQRMGMRRFPSWNSNMTFFRGKDRFFFLK